MTISILNLSATGMGRSSFCALLFGRSALYSLDTNDSRFARSDGYQLGEESYNYLKDSFNCLYAEGVKAPR